MTRRDSKRDESMHGFDRLRKYFLACICRVVVGYWLVLLAGSNARAVDLPSGTTGGAIQIHGPGVRPKLFFACCDQGIVDLESWVSNSEVISELQELHAGLAVQVGDFSDARAQAVRKLNAAGIPLTAWFVLTGEQGYYLNSDNAAQAAERFAKFEKWSRANDLHWDGVGLDVEPNFQQLQALGGHKWQLTRLMVRRYFDEGQVQSAREEYGVLIRQIQSSGYPVQTYQINFLANERAAHTTLLERLLGLVDVRGDEEVLMVYSNMNRRVGPAVVLAYAGNGTTIAIGSTLGAGQPGVGFGPLDWEEFSRDLVVASHFSFNGRHLQPRRLHPPGLPAALDLFRLESDGDDPSRLNHEDAPDGGRCRRVPVDSFTDALSLRCAAFAGHRLLLLALAAKSQKGESRIPGCQEVVRSADDRIGKDCASGWLLITEKDQRYANCNEKNAEPALRADAFAQEGHAAKGPGHIAERGHGDHEADVVD